MQIFLLVDEAPDYYFDMLSSRQDRYRPDSSKDKSRDIHLQPSGYNIRGA